jgi:hypothetical protein
MNYELIIEQRIQKKTGLASAIPVGRRQSDDLAAAFAGELEEAEAGEKD